MQRLLFGAKRGLIDRHHRLMPHWGFVPLEYLILITLTDFIILPKELIWIELILSILFRNQIDLLVIKLLNIFKSHCLFGHYIFYFSLFSLFGFNYLLLLVFYHLLLRI